MIINTSIDKLQRNMRYLARDLETFGFQVKTIIEKTPERTRRSAIHVTVLHQGNTVVDTTIEAAIRPDSSRLTWQHAKTHIINQVYDYGAAPA